MSKTDVYEYNLLRFTFNAVPISSFASTVGSSALWLSLHTADPGDPGSTASEGGYAAYARVATERSTAANGWAVSSGTGAAAASASPVSNVDFAQAVTTSTGTFTHFAVNLTSGSTGPQALYTGTVTPNINFSQNVTPRLTTASSITED